MNKDVNNDNNKRRGKISTFSNGFHPLACLIPSACTAVLHGRLGKVLSKSVGLTLDHHRGPGQRWWTKVGPGKKIAPALADLGARVERATLVRTLLAYGEQLAGQTALASGLGLLSRRFLTRSRQRHPSTVQLNKRGRDAVGVGSWACGAKRGRWWICGQLSSLSLIRRWTSDADTTGRRRIRCQFQLDQASLPQRAPITAVWQD
ncbi:hypothetical protein T11_904 [Trichinella zimbabwensis]|uniref:Uncharacterized protein n=1 Tax=Trichinella zimbabwensis TaxID=268475 RepID=A0A0V1I6C8_9BILA|nr:hypothetical protein T11_904 [Trichinella zimbabwensis]